MRQVAVGHHREILARERRQAELGAARFYFELPLFAAGADFNLRPFGKLADDIVERMRGNRGRPVLRYFRRRAFDDCQVHVGCGQPEFSASRLKQDVRQDRNRRTPFDDTLNMGERPEESAALDGKLHGF